MESIIAVEDYNSTEVDPEIVKDLCQRFGLPVNDSLCNSSSIHAEEFKRLFGKVFPIGKATYDDVQNKLARYQYCFDEPVRDANGRISGIDISYDIIGNRLAPIRFDFDTDWILTNIQIFIGGS